MRIAGIALLLALALVAGCAKPPLVPETPWGPAQGVKYIAAACSTRTTGPSGGQVAYQFDWGDGTQSAWSGLVDGGVAFGDTHSWTQQGRFEVKARARNAQGKASEWSEPFYIYINPGEGEIRWKFTYTDPEDPEDSCDFSLNTFGIGPDGSAIIGNEYGAVVSRAASGSVKWFPSPDGDEFFAAPAIADDGTIYIACENESLYALNANLTRRWTAPLDLGVHATAAIGADGAVFVQTDGDSCYCIEPTGARRWAAWTGGGPSSPVVGPDGTVFVATDNGLLYALNPADGSRKGQYSLGSQSIFASPAIDLGRGAIYVANEEGRLASVGLADLSLENWTADVGPAASTPVIGADGRVYVGGGGKLHCLSPENGNPHWSFDPPLGNGTVSSPAISQDGYAYALVSIGKKDFEDPDSLYAVNPDGTRRWATALGEGSTDDIWSSVKLDSEGNIYVASGTVAWSVRGISPPAQSSWPQFGRDPQNSGRAR